MRHSRRSRRGGDGINYQLEPAPYAGQGVGTSGVDIQFVAGQAGGRRRRHRGGSGVNLSLSPANFDGQGVGTSGVDIQFVAGQAGGRRRRTRGRRSRSRRGGAMAMLPLTGGRRTRRSRRTRRRH